jgi:hypothetical protein
MAVVAKEEISTMAETRLETLACGNDSHSDEINN